MLYKLGISCDKPVDKYTIHQGKVYRWEIVFNGNAISHYKWVEEKPNTFHIQWVESKLLNIKEQKDKAIEDYIEGCKV
jgi:hypothetical protein